MDDFKPKDFHAWRDRVGLTSWDQVAKILGLSRREIYRYQRGEKKIPRVVALACIALEGAHNAGTEWRSGRGFVASAKRGRG